MSIKLERIRDLFDEDIANELFDIVEGTGECQYNSAQACRQFDGWNFGYCEGYLHEWIGHAFNSYVDGSGNKHYFDLSQEYLNKKHNIPFSDELELVTEMDGEDIIEEFNQDGFTHFVTIGTTTHENVKDYLRYLGSPTIAFQRMSGQL